MHCQTQVLVPNGAALHPEKRHMVLDGRMKSTPNPLRSFALFFAVENTTEGDTDRQVNMLLKEGVLNLECKLELPCGQKKDRTLNRDKGMPAIPLMYNPKLIKKHTRLLCERDAGIQRVAKEETVKRAEEEVRKRKAKESEKTASTTKKAKAGE